MFIYENGNSLNLTFKGNVPVENPEVVITGYTNGASLKVNGTDVITVDAPVSFEGKAKTVVYQRDEKLFITFHGITGMSDPEISIDEVENNIYNLTVNGESVTLQFTDEEVTIVDAPSESTVEETEQTAEPEVLDEVIEEPEEE